MHRHPERDARQLSCTVRIQVAVGDAQFPCFRSMLPSIELLTSSEFPFLRIWYTEICLEDSLVEFSHYF